MTIQIKVTDEEMKLLQEAARVRGTSVENVAEATLRAGLVGDQAAHSGSKRSEGSFASCFGMFTEGVGSLSNADIDADIAKAISEHVKEP